MRVNNISEAHAIYNHSILNSILFLSRKSETLSLPTRFNNLLRFEIPIVDFNSKIALSCNAIVHRLTSYKF